MKEPKKKNIKLKIILTYVFAISIASVIFYFIIPYLLNYGPGTINTSFDREISGGLYYYQQILLAVSCLIFVVAIVLFFFLKDINNYKNYLKQYKKTKDPNIKKHIDYIKKICLVLPNRLLLVFIFVPLIFSCIVLFMQTSYLTSSDFKLVLVIFILSTLTISITNTYIRKLLSQILIDLENTDTYNVRKSSIISRLLLQILPLVAVCIVFTYLVVSSLYEKNNSELLLNYYNTQFKTDIEKINVSSEEELKDALNNIILYSDQNYLFIADKDFNFIYQTGELSDFFKKYAKELSLSNGYKIYDYYGTTGQGTLYPIDVNGDTYYVGAYYLVYSDGTSMYISVLLLLLIFICTIILYTFAKEFSQNIKTVADSLEIISKDNSFTEKKLYITSTDEIGRLIEVYNTIQSLTIKHLNQIHDSQTTLMERERLASLGQLIGGIAHNLKTPIMSISGAAEGLDDLIKEYDSSIDDPEVNSQDHHDIAKDMFTWTSKIKTHTEYMSDVITAVKGQAVNFSSEESVSFTVEELIKRVSILMKHELKNAIIYLNIKMMVDENITIKGDVNILVQVINNMISNSIQAYNGKTDQSIDLIVDKKDNNLLITVKDYGSGLTEEVKNKLFREMITTKGKNGTGLGLYMSYSTIRAHFNGNITVESEEGKGSTFTIILPLRKAE